MDANLAALDQVKSIAIDLGMKFGPNVLVAIIIMAAGYFAARWTAGVVGRSLRRFEFEPPVRQLMLNITRALVLLLFAIMALQNLGVELLPLIAGLGVAGAGIALAMQGVLANLVAGLT
ncbi:MAG: mechanosensitive ion channel family protein, partial [Burkholderiales bacterium]